MLTKDLIRFRILKGKLLPGFIDPSKRDLLDFAEELIALFSVAEPTTRGELEEASTALVERFQGNALVARGLVKLVFDRARFHTPDDERQPSFRAEVFSAGARLLAEAALDTPEDYFEGMTRMLGQPVAALRQSLYQDLAIHHPLERFKSLTPLKLLHRYNLALIQGVLLHTTHLEIELPESEPRSLRQLLKYLRFHQLFAQIQKTGPHAFKLKIDGPMALFGATRKYGLQLGRFLPGLMVQQRWSLRAEVRPRGKVALLELDESCGIRPGQARFHAYVPEGVSRFAQNFGEKQERWRLLDSCEVLALKGELYCFPDYLFEHQDGRRVALELFHPWHKSHLPLRLKQLTGAKGVPLILGVHAKLARHKDLIEPLAASAYYADWGFTFNDLPTRRSVLKLLDAFAERGPVQA